MSYDIHLFVCIYLKFTEFCVSVRNSIQHNLDLAYYKQTVFCPTQCIEICLYFITDIIFSPIMTFLRNNY